MKKLAKTLFASICVLVFVFTCAPIAASAAPADNTAYLCYMDTAYKYIYLGDPLPGVKETKATVTGVGQYTVGLDFTGTADGKAVGASAVIAAIQMGENNFPGYFIQLDSIEINGEDVSFAKGYTSPDDAGTTTCYTILNSWVGVVPDNARTPDGDLSSTSTNIVDGSAFKEVKTIYVTFTLLDANGNGPAKEVTSDTTVADADATTANPTDSSSIPKTGVISYGLLYGTGAILTGLYAVKRRVK